jgi:hypothetical protein
MPARLLHHIRSNLVAYLALFVALGGTSYAAFTVPRNSVDAAAIRNHVITPVKFDGRLIVGHVALRARIRTDGFVISAAPRVTTSGWGANTGTSSFVVRQGRLTLSKPLPASCSLVASDDGGFPEGGGVVNVIGQEQRSASRNLIVTIYYPGQAPSGASTVSLIGVCP